MRFRVFSLLLGFAAASVSFLSLAGAAASRQQPPPAEQTQSPAEIQATNDRLVKEVSEKIAGKENEPAEKVFKNIEVLKGVRAGQLVRIMNGGYSRALGVSCTHCHVEDDFSDDQKRPFRAAREMAVMHRDINRQLGEMKDLKSEKVNRAINCSTCHRGSVDPMKERK